MRTIACSFLAALVWAATSANGSLLYVVNQGAGTVGVYTTSGTPVNPNLITGLIGAWGIAISGPDLYVSSFGNGIGASGKVGKYTTSGAVINADLVTGIYQPASIAVSGSDLFVGFAGGSSIGKYTTSGVTVNPSFITTDDPEGVTAFGVSLYAINIASGSYRVSQWNAATGATINSTLIPGVGQSYGMAIDATNIYVVKSFVGQIGKYNAITGAAVNGSLITGLQNPYGAVVSGSNLFVTSFYPNSIIGEYTTSGATVNAQLVTGLNRPYTIALAPDDAIPEPGTATLAALSAMRLILRRRPRS